MIVGVLDLIIWVERLMMSIYVAAMWFLWRVLVYAHVNIVAYYIMMPIDSCKFASCWHIVVAPRG